MATRWATPSAKLEHKSKMAESIKKIIVDSRYFISGDAGSGVYELPEVVEIHGTQVLYLQQLSLVNTWYSVDETSNQFYLVD